jgi:predicted ATP-grasp superfamily ATP-dependent carboligase
MRVFVYEHLTATGNGRAAESAGHGMYLEGRAMRDAAVADFTRVSAHAVVVLPEEAAVEPDEFMRVAAGADWTLLIAPETDGVLADLAERVVSVRGRLLGPVPSAIRLTADKLALADHWRTHGVPTAATSAREPTACEAFPVVWKPRDGAGSTDTLLLHNPFEVARARGARDPNRPMILQEFVPGRAASVAFLCGPTARLPLAPTFQLLSGDGSFKYRGGELPVPQDLAARAVALGRRAVACVPGLVGYVGVDLVLGDAADGSGDRAIELNPRLTTSYIGLRASAEFNIAEVMMRVAAGEPVGALGWKRGGVRFSADGTISAV